MKANSEADLINQSVLRTGSHASPVLDDFELPEAEFDRIQVRVLLDFAVVVVLLEQVFVQLLKIF